MLLKLRPKKVTVVFVLEPRVPVNRMEELSQQNETPYRRRVKEKHTKRNFGSSSGRTSSGKLQLFKRHSEFVLVQVEHLNASFIQAG
jgi:hypothetical protein